MRSCLLVDLALDLPLLVWVAGGAAGVAACLALALLLLLSLTALRLRFAKPRLNPLAASGRPAPTSEAWAASARLAATIQALGWAHLTTLVDDRLFRGARIELHLFRRQGDPDGFTITVTRVTPPGGEERAVVDLQVSTRYGDGSALVTTSSETTATLPARPAVSLERLPGCLEPEQLLAVHRLRRARDDAGREPCQVPAPELALTLERDMQEDLLHAERLGLLVPDPEGGWRTTVQGALHLSWAAWLPVGLWRRARLQRRARAWIAAAHCG